MSAPATTDPQTPDPVARKEIFERMVASFLPVAREHVRAVERGGQVLSRAAFAEQVRPLSRANGWISSFWIAWQWSVIAAAIAIAVLLDHPVAYGLAVIVIATRQHALGILVHDACHWSLYRHRPTNDLLSDLFCAFPLLGSTELYRRWHFPHHRLVNSPEDPEVLGERTDPRVWHWPGSTGRLLRVLFLNCLCGWGGVRYLMMTMIWSPLSRLHVPSSQLGGISWRSKALFIGWMAALLTTVTLTGLWFCFLLFWVLPMFTVMVTLFHLRSFAEHKAVPDIDELSNTRTTIATWLERCLIAPLNVGYHLEHHLFPSVPFHRLARLHAVLRDDATYAAGAEVVHGYLDMRHGVLSRLVGRTACATERITRAEVAVLGQEQPGLS